MNKQSRSRAKRAVRIRLTLIYTLMVVSVALLVAVLYLFIQGYRFNRYEGQLEQGGLVQFNSAPSDASIWLDNAQLGIHTQGRLTLSAGKHTISMRKDGYYDWNKDVTVQPGAILWLHYVRLVPKQLAISTPVDFSGVSSDSTSLDGKKLAVIENATQPIVKVVTADSDTPQTATITLPATSFAAPAAGESQSFEASNWAHDNRYLLIKHTYGDKVEWLSVDSATPATVKNITRLLGVTATSLVYSKDDANTVFVLDNNSDIRRANVDQKTLSGPLVQDVASFNLYDSSTVAYVTKPSATDGKRIAAYLTLGAKKPRVVSEFDSAITGDIQFKAGSYGGNRYLAIATGETVKILTGDLSASDAEKPAAFTAYGTFTVTGGVQYMGFSLEEKRFLYAHNATTITTFDLDSRTAVAHDFATEQTKEIHWIDRYHFTALENGGLVMYDYDGTNGHTLLSKAIDNTALLLQNSRYIYGLQPAATGGQLARIQMILE